MLPWPRAVWNRIIPYGALCLSGSIRRPRSTLGPSIKTHVEQCRIAQPQVCPLAHFWCILSDFALDPALSECNFKFRGSPIALLIIDTHFNVAPLIAGRSVLRLPNNTFYQRTNCWVESHKTPWHFLSSEPCLSIGNAVMLWAELLSSTDSCLFPFIRYSDTHNS